MKRTLSRIAGAALAMMLLLSLCTACGAQPDTTTNTPQATSDSAQQAEKQEDKSSSDTVPAGKLRELRGVYGVRPETETYFVDLLMIEDKNYHTVIDMRQAKEMFLCTKAGCPHGVPECEAAYDTGADALRVWGVTEEGIFWIDGGDTKPNTIYQTDHSGGNRKKLFVIEGQLVEYPRMLNSEETKGVYQAVSPKVNEACSFYADDTSIYLQVLVTQETPGVFPGFASLLEVWRIELATGKHTVLFRGEPNTESIGQSDIDWIVGCTDDAFLLDIALAPTPEQLEAASPRPPVLHHTVVELPAAGAPENGPLRVLYEYDETEFANHVTVDNTLYLLDSEQKTIEAVDLVSGQSRTLVNTFPSSDSAFLKAGPDGTLVIDFISQESMNAQSYSVDKESGALTPFTLQYVHNGHLQAVQICAQYQDDYLVIYENRRQTVNSIGTDGQPYSFDSDVAQYALISKQDYYAGNANYREIEMLPQ